MRRTQCRGQRSDSVIGGFEIKYVKVDRGSGQSATRCPKLGVEGGRFWRQRLSFSASISQVPIF
jgi:hypothetical protein